MTELPFYEPSGNEISLFEHAFSQRLPLLIKGPTGCGKTRFVAHMACPPEIAAVHRRLPRRPDRRRPRRPPPDRRRARYWCDGPLTRAVREGGICYLDEVVEARKDTTVVLHPLADDRRVLPIDRTGELLRRRRLHAGRVLQPRLPEPAQGHEAIDPPALRLDALRLPVAPSAKKRS
jgi:nitric oxide reductase NorQ protein